jgi:hypothetical protein
LGGGEGFTVGDRAFDQHFEDFLGVAEDFFVGVTMGMTKLAPLR